MANETLYQEDNKHKQFASNHFHSPKITISYSNNNCCFENISSCKKEICQRKLEPVFPSRDEFYRFLICHMLSFGEMSLPIMSGNEKCYNF